MMGPSPACACPHIKLGSEFTEARNWSPDCIEHGTDSAWWNSEPEVAKRQLQATRLRVLGVLAQLRRSGRISLEAASKIVAALDGTREATDDGA